jgi:hypothetical protein
MPQGRRFGPDNPSPTASSLAQYIREHGVDIEDKHVAAVWYFHPEWQPGHAEQVNKERAANRERKEQEKAQKAQEKAKKDQEKAAEKERKAQEKAAKDAEKAEKAASDEGADGDDSSDEPAKTSRRLRTRGEAQEPVAAGVSETSF